MRLFFSELLGVSFRSTTCHSPCILSQVKSKTSTPNALERDEKIGQHNPCPERDLYVIDGNSFPIFSPLPENDPSGRSPPTPPFTQKKGIFTAQNLSFVGCMRILKSARPLSVIRTIPLVCGKIGSLIHSAIPK